MGPCRLLKTIFAQFLGKYRVVLALFGKIERLTFTGTFDAFQHLVKSHSFKQICFPHRSEMGVLKSFLWHLELHHSWFQARRRLKSYFLTIPYPIGSLRTGCLRASRRAEADPPGQKRNQSSAGRGGAARARLKPCILLGPTPISRI